MLRNPDSSYQMIDKALVP